MKWGLMPPAFATKFFGSRWKQFLSATNVGTFSHESRPRNDLSNNNCLFSRTTAFHNTGRHSRRTNGYSYPQNGSFRLFLSTELRRTRRTRAVRGASSDITRPQIKWNLNGSIVETERDEIVRLGLGWRA